LPYKHLNWTSFEDAKLKEVFEHTEMYLFDVYGMLRTLPPSDRDGGGGNFAASLVLLCIIDGLATWVWPKQSEQDDQEQRFKQLIRQKLPWGPEGKGKWVHKGSAAAQLYTEFRNPLVHELAQDKQARSRPDGYGEPVIGTWGDLPTDMQDIEKIDALLEWDNAWPIMRTATDAQGEPRYKLVVSGLYWAVKQMANEMISEAQTISE